MALFRELDRILRNVATPRFLFLAPRLERRDKHLFSLVAAATHAALFATMRSQKALLLCTFARARLPGLCCSGGLRPC